MTHKSAGVLWLVATLLTAINAGWKLGSEVRHVDEIVLSLAATCCFAIVTYMSLTRPKDK